MMSLCTTATARALRSSSCAKSALRQRFFSSTTESLPNSNSTNAAKLIGCTIIGLGLYDLGKDSVDVVKSTIESVGMSAIRCFDPETAHEIAVKAASYNLLFKDKNIDGPELHVKLWNQTFDNPIGLAAGFDKNAECMNGMISTGFGFVEIGSVTPLPQVGNPKPRVFRLTEDRGVINRYGFNSDGIEAVAPRLESFIENRSVGKSSRYGVIGVNLGKNKTSEDASADYVKGVSTLGPFADYLVINVSSPNTPGLRSLQGRAQLKKLVESVIVARNNLGRKSKPPLLIKIAPDLTMQDKKDIASVALTTSVDGLIVSNTTVSRPSSLKSTHATETGGLSGTPVKEMALEALSDMYILTEGKVPLIGVGGIATGKDAYERICAGASLVQMYSTLVYDGPSNVQTVKKDLRRCLRAGGFASVQEAVGSAHTSSKK